MEYWNFKTVYTHQNVLRKYRNPEERVFSLRSPSLQDFFLQHIQGEILHIIVKFPSCYYVIDFFDVVNDFTILQLSPHFLEEFGP